MQKVVKHAANNACAKNAEARKVAACAKNAEARNVAACVKNAEGSASCQGVLREQHVRTGARFGKQRLHLEVQKNSRFGKVTPRSSGYVDRFW